MNKPKDKYRWENADICIKCDSIQATPKGNGIRWNVCGKCVKELKKLLKHYEKHGLYAVRSNNEQT